MSAPNKPVTILTEEECWEKLASHSVGRLVTWVGNVVHIMPLNYVVDGRTLVFRTASGTKLSKIAINPSVILEVDDYDDKTGWSVVVRGEAERLQISTDTAEAENLPLKPMIATLKFDFVRITPTSMTGRKFMFGPEPDREAFQEG
ncbi:MAG TPA: pyridoxamine 5'-phosphate oxidase family protein [Microbacteriaceae bacterium]|nr:pyridoxamine 5'-phosphate oxidase family protein [Microbacteriaceae bacterium]